ncbi:hypothetical protein HA402_010438 [Bradysia odoriphaga]|nr:hypothetical protein HA402_010438 [Bradysia odoriphaga]
MEREQIVSPSGIMPLRYKNSKDFHFSSPCYRKSWSRVFNEDSDWSGVSSFTTDLDASIEKPSIDQTTANEPKNVDSATIQNHINVHSLIKSYQQRGHFAADLDPLGITTIAVREEHGVKRRADESVTKNYFNFSASDMDKEFYLPPSTFIAGSRKTLKLREIIESLENVYCNKIGIEYMHNQDHEKIYWIRKQFETPENGQFTNDEKRLILARLTRATGFETFLQKKYQSEKRFGLEGCEMMIPALKEIIDVSSTLGVKSIIMGMAHRGRLNVLSNVCRKPLNTILAQFAGLKPTDSGSGDVKYHLGTFIERINRVSSKPIRLAIVANPSHLEAVNPVVQGRTKAEQFYSGDKEGKTVMSILVHGDASTCGQGVVYESMHLSDLPDYTTKGTIHVIVNNQIGFTTDPRYSRSSRYCTDVAKVVNAPILHVNADDPEAVIRCARVCAEWRNTFHSDIVLDLVSYRRNGHNEIDEPMFTQPLMYQRISQLKTCYELYSEKLIGEGVVTQLECTAIWEEYQKICEEAHAECLKETTIKFKDWIDSPWSGFFEGKDPNVCLPTGVPEETLNHIANIFSSPPPNSPMFVLHRGIERVLAGRKKMTEARLADWSLGEAFAIGSLVKEGIHVRISGQDVERGTFSHRHHYLHHQEVDKSWYCPLQHVYPDQAHYQIQNSSLSEFAVLGFELGYSMTNPNSLVIWEAQFGDFANTAQCIIDQFISSGESKWIRQSGIVLLLPHGLEGMGPEHSSCRIERFLAMSDDDADEIPEMTDTFEIDQLRDINWFVTNCSTPANLFHVLRRQLALPFRKPLIVATPKSLLRLPACRSSFDDMTKNTAFQRLIPDHSIKDPEKVTKLVLCTGKTYYDLEVARKERGKSEQVALVRIEQICPLPYDLLTKELLKYPNADVAWAQEEHKNSGCWPYLQPRLSTLLENRCLLYHGRPPSAAPATGSIHRYLWEQEEYLSALFGDKPAPINPNHCTEVTVDQSEARKRSDHKELGDGQSHKKSG